jgi:cyclopropane fatty-acyl-phospholipid synthase-like methyltransferase
MSVDFSALDFESFRRMAKDEHLSPYEKIGFPDSYRQGFEEKIFLDICSKIPLNERHKTVLDIGPGCSGLAHLLVEHCQTYGHRLLLADSEEMLAHLPNAHFITQIPRMFPLTLTALREQTPDGVDMILCYSVLQYLYVDTDIEQTLAGMWDLLKSGGVILLGDIPNASMRRRFFSSKSGIAYHQESFPGTLPDMTALLTKSGEIDDMAVLSIIGQMRRHGADAYVLPQNHDLPMANRREDILIRKP